MRAILIVSCDSRNFRQAIRRFTVAVMSASLLVGALAGVVLPSRGWHGYRPRTSTEAAVLAKVQESYGIFEGDILGPLRIAVLGYRVTRISSSRAHCPPALARDLADPSALNYEAEIQVTTIFGLALRTIRFECGGLQYLVLT